MSELKTKEYKRFEDIKHVRANGSEYWLARELALVLDYAQWRNFSKVIGKAMIACRNSGHDVFTILLRSAKSWMPGKHH
jgi:DNA-damage-inducible protein D